MWTGLCGFHGPDHRADELVLEVRAGGELSNRAPLYQRTWREATREDRIAYKKWRLFDPKGPMNAHSSWDREVASANRFFRWAVEEGHLPASPIATRAEYYRDRQGRMVVRDIPRETSHRGPRNEVRWFTPAMYRTWRDVGIRGYLPDGQEDSSFRGRWASRDAAYTDLMIRTGLRNSEQSSLSMYELPERVAGISNFRTILPSSIAKGGSGRAIYIPGTVLEDVWDYVEMERADAIAYARRNGLYDTITEPLIIENPPHPVAMTVAGVRWAATARPYPLIVACRITRRAADGTTGEDPPRRDHHLLQPETGRGGAR